jgi:hypothetical protein
MNSVVLAISVAYVVMAVLLLGIGLTARLAWWVKAFAIIVTSAFFIEAFFATRSLLGWPGSSPLPHRFQLLWTRVVEPDPKLGDPGAIFLWVEELDDNNVPSGTPRSYRLKYTPPLADRSNQAKDEIMSGNPQEGTADDVAGTETSRTDANLTATASETNRDTSALTNIDQDLLRPAPGVHFRPLSGVALPPKQ